QLLEVFDDRIGGPASQVELREQQPRFGEIRSRDRRLVQLALRLSGIASLQESQRELIASRSELRIDLQHPLEFLDRGVGFPFGEMHAPAQQVAVDVSGIFLEQSIERLVRLLKV